MKISVRVGLVGCLIISSILIQSLFLPLGISSEIANQSEPAWKIDSALVQRLDQRGPDEFIAVELAVAGGISAKELERDLDSTCVTLDERRTRGLLRLQSIAATAQADLLERLDDLERAGQVQNIQSHWLSNRISVEVKVSSVGLVATDPDVTNIFQFPEPVRITPDDTYAKPTVEAQFVPGVQPNLTYIGADSAWRMGYTGEGRIVSILDEVSGIHPALYDNWKGHDGDSSAAWWGSGNFPASGHYHGTHVLGIMVGHDDTSGDTIGVAPGATWIASIARNAYGYEWLADPDRNPNTTSDIPDVLNVSWGTGCNGCTDRYWEEMDMLEAMGTVIVVAAGNSGSDPLTTCSPADRALDSLTSFAIGNVNHRTNIVWFSSSRGPSRCDSVSIKPNVCAPGVNIRSSVYDSIYEYRGGTSMAAPHVAGAVAILRQWAPNATTRQIKESLIGGARPYGDTWPNNHWGWGNVYIPASMEFLAQQVQADLKVSEFEYTQVNVGDTLVASISITNRGNAIDSVFAIFDKNYDGLRVLTDSIHFGRFMRGQKVQGEIQFRCLFDDTLMAGPILPVRFTMQGSNNSVDTAYLQLQAGIESEPSFFTHKTDRLHFTVSNFGQYGLGQWSINDMDQKGFCFGDTTRNRLYEAALLIGLDQEHVSDGFRDLRVKPDDDFWFAEDQPMIVREPGILADQETESVFTDGRAENPIGVEIMQETFSWFESAADNFVLMKYEITNVSREPLYDLQVGMAFDWLYYETGYCDTMRIIDFLPGRQLGYTYSVNCGVADGQYRALVILNEEGVSAFQASRKPQYLSTGLTDSAKFAMLSGGIQESPPFVGHRETLYYLMATGPFDLPPGDSAIAAFAVIAADSLSELMAAVSQVESRWRSIVNNSPIPENYWLSQNYPNPFNNGSVIEYGLPEGTNVYLDIYNILGQRVKRLVDQYQPAGTHQVFWDGSDSSGETVASGVYLYRIRTSSFSISKKMILLK